MIKYASLDARAAALLVAVSPLDSEILRRGLLPTDSEKRSLSLDARISLGWRLLALRSALRDAGLSVVRDALWSPQAGAFVETWHVALTRREACASVRRSSR